MYKLNAFFLFLMFLALMSACSSGGKIMQLTLEDNGKAVEVEADGTFQVTLDSNPTTGYQWEVEQFVPTILEQVGEATYEPDSKDEKLVGGGGKETFTFKALAIGQTDLKLIYHRQWETDVPPINTFIITVVVK